MTDERLPYMPVFVDEFDTSQTVRRLNFEGQGIYFALLRHQWRDGFLPETEDAIRDILELPSPRYPELWALVEQKFPAKKGKRMNVKLATLRRHAIRKVKTARRLALMRWHSQGIAKADARSGSKGNEIEVKEKEPTWVQKLGAVWRKVYKGEPPWGKLGKLLLPVKDATDLEARFTAYCYETPARFVDLSKFVSAYGTWGEKRGPQLYTYEPGVSGPDMDVA